MSLVVNQPPYFTIVGQEGCPACAMAKEGVAQLLKEKPAELRAFRYGFIDIEKANGSLNFPVKALPTFHIEFPDGKAYVMDAMDLAGQNLAPDAEGLTKLLNAILRVYRRETGQ